MVFAHELVCACGCTFRCPRCDAWPPPQREPFRVLRLLQAVFTSLLECRQPPPQTALGEDASSTGLPAHRFAARTEPAEDVELWVSMDAAAQMVGASRKSLAITGTALAKTIRRRRRGHTYVWYKPDLEEFAHVRNAGKLSVNGALRVYAALVEQRL